MQCKIKFTCGKLLVVTVLVAVILYGFFLRTNHLDSQPYWMDEGYTINAIMAISEHGSMVLGSGQTYFCPLYCHPAAYLAKLFGNSAFSYRLLSALAGTTLILLVYSLTLAFWSRPVALLAAFFTVFSYWQIAWSRQARWYTLFSVFFWAAIFFFWRSIHSEKLSIPLLVLSTFSVLLAILTHRIGLVLPIILGIWLFSVKKQNLNSLSARSKNVIIAVTTLLLVTISLSLIFSHTSLSALWGHLTLAYELPYYLSFYLRNYWIFFVLIIYYAYKADDSKREPLFVLLTALLAYLIPLSFFTELLQYRYLFHLTPILFMLGSAGLIELVRSLKFYPARLGVITIIISLFFYSGSGVLFPKEFYFLESDDPIQLGSRPHYSYTPQPNFNKAYDYVKKHRQEGDVVISTYAHFTKIFLGENGYWLAIDYTGRGKKMIVETPNGPTDYYTGAPIINSLSDLKKITLGRHGFIIFDSMAVDGRLGPDILFHIKSYFKLAMYDKISSYSEIWVYYF